MFHAFRMRGKGRGLFTETPRHEGGASWRSWGRPTIFCSDRKSALQGSLLCPSSRMRPVAKPHLSVHPKGLALLSGCLPFWRKQAFCSFLLETVVAAETALGCVDFL